MRGIAVIAWVAAIWLGVAFSYADSTLYAGQPASEAKITLRNWGSGTIEDSSDTTFVGSRSLKLSTRGLFSGGWIEFATPVDIRTDLNAPNGVMRFALRFPGVSAAGAGATGGMPRFGAPGEMAGGPQAPGGIGAPGALSGAGGGGGGQTAPPTLRELRLVLETSDGKRTEVLVPLQNLRPDESGWQTLSVPLRSIPDLRDTNGQIRKIGVFGDTVGTFYIGEIRTLRESGSLQGYIAVQNMYGSVFTSRSQERLSIASGDELVFYGVVEGVSTPVEYRWSFSGDPSQVDGIGNAIRRRFPKRGTYTVHLTIVDPAGIRSPITAKVEIQVN
ncbi:MAG: PKD domain-containing protein [Armatimonadota bacterium]|nr:PKD domain-containing protein [Armatimonadota bacterium]